MTILPGSLDYLYYNGILEHIPYEAYEIIPASPSGISQNNLSAEIQEARSLKNSGLNNSNMNYNGMGTLNMKGTDYLDMAQKGGMYGSYGNFNDSYYGNSYQQGGLQPQAQMYGGNNSRGVKRKSHHKNGRAYINGGVYNKYDKQLQRNGGYDFNGLMGAETNDTKEGVLNSHPGAKGLLATLILVITPILLIKRAVKPKAATNIKPAKTRRNRRAGKNNSVHPSSPPKSNKGFWEKINPRNWFRSGKK